MDDENIQDNNDFCSANDDSFEINNESSKNVKTSNNMTVTLNDVLDANFTPNTELENLIYEMARNYLK